MAWQERTSLLFALSRNGRVFWESVCATARYREKLNPVPVPTNTVPTLTLSRWIVIHSARLRHSIAAN